MQHCHLCGKISGNTVAPKPDSANTSYRYTIVLSVLALSRAHSLVACETVHPHSGTGGVGLTHAVLELERVVLVRLDWGVRHHQPVQEETDVATLATAIA